MFRDRTSAGNLLAAELASYQGKSPVVVAIPRGGLPVGAAIARSLEAPLEVALTKKIGHPYNKEYAIGAVSLEDVEVSAPARISPEYLEAETERLRASLRERHQLFYRKKKPLSLEGRCVIVTDDGIATGNTLIITIKLIASRKPSELIVAIPVAPPAALRRIQAMPEVDRVICLESPEYFSAVGQFYEDFRAVTDAEAIEIFEAGALPESAS